MPDLLLELLSEEIPARMQASAAESLRKMVTDALVERGLVYEGAKAFVTPRRLALAVHGLPARQPDTHEERKGPRVGAPQPAIDGFLKAAGLTSIDEAIIETDPKKGQFYVARIHRHGRPTPDVIAEIVPSVVRAFPWPKSMRWGAASAQPGSLRWVRPLQSILATFGPETEEPEVVRFEIDGLQSGDATRGHRFLSEGTIRVRRLDDWLTKLEAAYVVADRERRKDIILNDAKDLALAQGLELVEDQGLLEEIAGLVEWPVVLMGAFDAAFLEVPDEVIRATIRANQKCFVLRDPSTGRLANRFVLVSNLAATDGGAAIVAGNERVIRARLSDAKFFWDTDRKATLESRLPKFANITFHEKLGSQAERIKRIEALAVQIADTLSARPGYFDGRLLEGDDLAREQEYHREQVRLAARLAKADLLTEVVGEFPEVQGLMGKYYARLEGLPEDVAVASEEHYKPQGPSDRVPTSPVSVAVALADKIDTLVGFWAIDEKPTGSKDPYALRRAALGVVRIVLENSISVEIHKLIANFFLDNLMAERFIIREIKSRILDDEESGHLRRSVFDIYYNLVWGKSVLRSIGYGMIDRMKEDISVDSKNAIDAFDGILILSNFSDYRDAETRKDFESELSFGDEVLRNKVESAQAAVLGAIESLSSDLLSFLADRLKVHLREQGARHDLVDAVFALGQEAGSATGTQGPQDDLLLVVRRVEALGRFLATEDGKNLLAGTKRAANILRIEEKKDGATYEGGVDVTLLHEPEERALADAIAAAGPLIQSALAAEDFEAAMAVMASLRAPVDAFFEKVTVNAPDAELRVNRLRLLADIRTITRTIADFDRIEG